MATNDPLFNVAMPAWYERMAYFWRGACFGFMVGFMVVEFRLGAADRYIASAVVVFVLSFLAVLPSTPKAWIEQRNRWTVLRRGEPVAPVSRAQDHQDG